MAAHASDMFNNSFLCLVFVFAFLVNVNCLVYSKSWGNGVLLFWRAQWNINKTAYCGLSSKPLPLLAMVIICIISPYSTLTLSFFFYKCETGTLNCFPHPPSQFHIYDAFDPSIKSGILQWFRSSYVYVVLVMSLWDVKRGQDSAHLR